MTHPEKSPRAFVTGLWHPTLTRRDFAAAGTQRLPCGAVQTGFGRYSIGGGNPDRGTGFPLRGNDERENQTVTECAEGISIKPVPAVSCNLISATLRSCEQEFLSVDRLNPCDPAPAAGGNRALSESVSPYAGHCSDVDSPANPVSPPLLSSHPENHRGESSSELKTSSSSRVVLPRGVIISLAVSLCVLNA